MKRYLPEMKNCTCADPDGRGFLFPSGRYVKIIKDQVVRVCDNCKGVYPLGCEFSLQKEMAKSGFMSFNQFTIAMQNKYGG